MFYLPLSIPSFSFSCAVDTRVHQVSSGSGKRHEHTQQQALSRDEGKGPGTRYLLEDELSQAP